MSNSKRNILDALNAKLQSEFKEFIESFEEKNAEATKNTEEISKRLQLLHEAIEFAEKTPNWPFNVNTIYKLGATVISPFLFTIINRISELGNELVDSLIR